MISYLNRLAASFFRCSMFATSSVLIATVCSRPAIREKRHGDIYYIETTQYTYNIYIYISCMGGDSRGGGRRTQLSPAFVI